MTVKYKVIPRKNPRNPEDPPKYYPSIKNSGRVSLRQLAKKAAEGSDLSATDMVTAVEALLNIIPQELADGKSVQLGDLGTFSLRIKTEGSDSEDAVSGSNITNTSIAYRPGKLAKQGLSAVEYQKESS